MPAQSVRSSARGATPPVPLNGYYPKWLKSDAGNVWLVTAPKTGTLLVMARQPFRNKTVAVGYQTSKLKEGSGLSAFHGHIDLDIA